MSGPRGRKSLPTRASRTDDFPADCDPTTATWGRSSVKSSWACGGGVWDIRDDQLENKDAGEPGGVAGAAARPARGCPGDGGHALRAARGRGHARFVWRTPARRHVRTNRHACAPRPSCRERGKGLSINNDLRRTWLNTSWRRLMAGMRSSPSPTLASPASPCAMAQTTRGEPRPRCVSPGGASGAQQSLPGTAAALTTQTGRQICILLPCRKARGQEGLSAPEDVRAEGDVVECLRRIA